MNSGIYTINNVITNDYYLGSAIDFKKRWGVHKSLLSRNKHYNPHLQRAWNKYGESNFEFKIIATCDKDKVRILEQEFLDKEVPAYNISTKASGHSGIVTDKMRETARKNGLAQKGKKKPKSYSEKLSRRMIGNKLGLGKNMSDKNKKALIERNLGNKYFEGKTHTKEHNEYMSNLLKERQFSEETKIKMSGSAKESKRMTNNNLFGGHKHSEESKRKISESIKARNAAKRAERSVEPCLIK